MALTTKVPPVYRTPYIPREILPDDVNKLMRKEITAMRKNLIKKQNRLKNHPDFDSDPRLLEYLQDLKVRDLKSKKMVQNTWARLRNLEKSNKTSITGKNETIKSTLETLKAGKYEGLFSFVTKENLGKFGEFVNWVKDQYGKNVYSARDIAMYWEERGELDLDTLQKGYEDWLRAGYKVH